MKQYGISSFKENKSSTDEHLESIKRRGFTVIKKVLSEDECKNYSENLESIYSEQEQSFGKENLELIKELDIARMPFVYNDSFIKLIKNKETLSIIKNILGNNFILQLQNGIINRNNKEHHQTSWHRDIPYQEYTTSQPISMNVFYCLSPFNKKTGGTILLPYSHLFPKAPSLKFIEENSIQPNLAPGDVVIFDSWIYHKAGHNTSDIIRYGINHVFTTPILKQQINIPTMLSGKYSKDQELSSILGYKFNITDSVDSYRDKKLKQI